MNSRNALGRSVAAACALFATSVLSLQQSQAATFDLSTATIADIQDAMDNGALTSEKLVQMYLARIDAYDQKGPKLNAVLTVNKNALAAARALDEERRTKGPRSPLHGIVVLPKDVFDTHDMPTTGGFKPMATSQPSRDAFVIARLRKAGAVILGKLNQSDWYGVAPSGGAEAPGSGYNNPWRLNAMKQALATDGGLDDPQYLVARHEGLALIRATVLATFAKHQLDALVYPTSPRPAQPIAPAPEGAGGGVGSATNIANRTGFPDLIVPAGVTNDGLPVTISFFGPAFSEPKLLAYGYDFEQATKARVVPKHTPLLAGDVITVKRAENKSLVASAP